jgi:hypothetical protein
MVFGRHRAPTAGARNEPSPLRKDSRPKADDWLQSIPAADVREGGESTWEAWTEESRRMDLAYADTQPSEDIPLLHDVVSRPEQQRIGGRWTADDVMALARRNNRVCPRPLLWAALYELVEGDRYADLSPPPVQPWTWKTLSNLQRRLRFRDHIAWADRHGKLDALARYLEALAEPDWVHMGEG